MAISREKSSMAFSLYGHTISKRLEKDFWVFQHLFYLDDNEVSPPSLDRQCVTLWNFGSSSEGSLSAACSRVTAPPSLVGLGQHVYLLLPCSCRWWWRWWWRWWRSGIKCGVGSHRTCSHFFAHSAYFNNFWQKIQYFDASQQKRVLSNCFATKQCLGKLKMWG